MKRPKFIVSVIALVVATLGIISILPAKYVEVSGVDSNKTQENLSAVLSADKIAKECDIFNQSDSDILAQSPSDKECYFAGCGGLF